MVLRRWFSICAVLSIAALSFSQQTPPTLSASTTTLTSEQRLEILAKISELMDTRVYVTGIDLKKWPQHLAKHQEEIDKAESTRSFTSAVNRAFREFGVSHLRLRSPMAARNRQDGIDEGGDDGLLQALQQSQSPRKETLTWADSETAVLRVFTFSKGYSRENIETLVSEANSKAKNLILDLRSNGGGATDNLKHLLSLLLPPDSVIGAFVNKRDAQKYAEVKNEEATDPVKIAAWMERKYKTSALKVSHFKGKIAVLTNRGSASASEICAAGLRDVVGAPIVGGKSAGAVLASVYGRLPYGYEIQYPVTDYVTVKGIRLEGNPLQPDIVADSGLETDEAIDKAIEALKTKPPTR